MYKILIISNDTGRVYKKKFYDSVEQFEKWLDKHTDNYYRWHQVQGFKFNGSSWMPVEKRKGVE